jgi:HTH-type transcriptional regulator/antitoxin HipB
MVNAIADIVRQLKSARKKKGLSQRAFARVVGIPQSRLSKIENGLVDIQTSTFLELSRFLDLEPLLIPRQLVPAVKSLTRQKSGKTSDTPIYSLDEEDNNV